MVEQAGMDGQGVVEQDQPLYFLSVNYYSAALLTELIASLGPNQGVVIVNNSLDDPDVHALAGGHVVVLDAPDNGGFGAGCNLGLQWVYSRSPQSLVWLINPDAQLLPDAVRSVHEAISQRPDTAILGTPVLDTLGEFWSGSGHFNRWTGAITSHAVTDGDPDDKTDYQNNEKTPTTPVSTRWVSGCSMVLNFAALGHCPQFDDAYFLYYEDCDLCERYFQQGKAIAVTPQPLVVHAVSSITGRDSYAKYVHATFSKLTFLRRHATLLALGLNLAYLLAQSLLLLRRDRSAALGRWHGIQQFLGMQQRTVSNAST